MAMLWSGWCWTGSIFHVAVWLRIAGVVILVGCNPRPRAPALENEPVYQNKREGFRFVVPEGWVQHAKADIPPGKTEKERLLVSYLRPVRGKPVFLEVSLADLPESRDLAAYLAESPYGTSKWRRVGTPLDLDINGVPATRYSYTTRVGKDDLIKEVTVFRRGERVYLFAGVYPTGDSQSREQLRRAAASTIWEG
jgi:hypothetical protein